jgi:tRNA(fMet)-specific endonuclease VapC
LLKYPDNERGSRLNHRLRSYLPDGIAATSIISVEEQMRGWLAAIAKERQAKRQVLGYAELGRLVVYLRAFTIVPFSDKAAEQFDSLRSAKIRLGTMDLKIAAIALVNQALLLSANLRDFNQVPGLKVENWLD